MNINERPSDIFTLIALLNFYEYPNEMHYKLYDRKGRSLVEVAKLESKDNIKGKFIRFQNIFSLVIKYPCKIG